MTKNKNENKKRFEKDSKRKVTEENNELEFLDAKGETAGAIAHDINNFLVAITGNISLAKISLDPENDAFKRLSQAEEACQWLMEYAAKLSSFAKAATPEFKKQPLVRLLNHSLHSTFKKDDVEWKMNIDDEKSVAEVDAALIKQVLVNIINNAVKSMKDGGTLEIKGERVKAGEVPTLADGEHIKITIQDSGNGIPPEKLKGIFTPTFKSKLGLGLPLAYYIVRKHSGYITLESEPGKGTTCTIFLPVHQKKE